jgi:hypothetical protein
MHQRQLQTEINRMNARGSSDSFMRAKHIGKNNDWFDYTMSRRKWIIALIPAGSGSFEWMMIQ